MQAPALFSHREPILRTSQVLLYELVILVGHGCMAAHGHAVRMPSVYEKVFLLCLLSAKITEIGRLDNLIR
jgi:hypothetical protein